MVGQKLGQYRLLERIARGGMGVVFRALDETLDREVAIKILNADVEDRERFRIEATTIARLNHPNIATVFELFCDGEWVMVMEFVRGETLEQLLDRLGRLTPEHAADLCMQALTALSYSHRMGVVHRDLKPSNLMVTTAGTVKVMDFGVARVAGAEHRTHAGLTMGTPAYMSPEQVKGDGIDARADLYALGVIFHRLITGQLPFSGKTPFAMAQAHVSTRPQPVRLLCPDLPEWTEAIVSRALAKAPEDRFQTADEFRHALKRAIAQAATLRDAPAGDATEPIAQFRHQTMSHRVAMWSTVAAAAMIVSVAGTRQWWGEAWRQPAPLPSRSLLVSPFGSLPGARANRSVMAVSRTTEGDAAAGIPPSSPAPPPAPDAATHAAFSKIKLFTVDGGRTTSRDVVLNLSPDRLTVLPTNGSGPLATTLYRDVARATYVHAKEPRWESSLSSPNPKFNLGFLGRARHWLVVQTKIDCVVLQLDGDQSGSILKTFEEQTGLVVERTAAQRGEAGRPK